MCHFAGAAASIHSFEEKHCLMDRHLCRWNVCDVPKHDCWTTSPHWAQWSMPKHRGCYSTDTKSSNKKAKMSTLPLNATTSYWFAQKKKKKSVSSMKTNVRKVHLFYFLSCDLYYHQVSTEVRIPSIKSLNTKGNILNITTTNKKSKTIND